MVRIVTYGSPRYERVLYAYQYSECVTILLTKYLIAGFAILFI